MRVSLTYYYLIYSVITKKISTNIAPNKQCALTTITSINIYINIYCIITHCVYRLRVSLPQEEIEM